VAGLLLVIAAGMPGVGAGKEKEQEATIVATLPVEDLPATIGRREVIVHLIGVSNSGFGEEGERVKFLGNEPRDFLKRMLLNQKVILREEAGHSKWGTSYRRNRHVYLLDGTHVNAEIIRKGYAHSASESHARGSEFAALEQEARKRGEGLWATLAPVDGSNGVASNAPAVEGVLVWGQPLGAREGEFKDPEVIPASKIMPRYPQLALARRTDAKIVLQVVVDEQGKVTMAEPVRKVTSDAGFEQAVVEAVKHWKYKPGTLDGAPVAVAFPIFVDFSTR
jgi:TonB family protein